VAACCGGAAVVGVTRRSTVGQCWVGEQQTWGCSRDQPRHSWVGFARGGLPSAWAGPGCTRSGQRGSRVEGGPEQSAGADDDSASGGGDQAAAGQGSTQMCLRGRGSEGSRRAAQGGAVTVKADRIVAKKRRSFFPAALLIRARAQRTCSAVAPDSSVGAVKSNALLLRERPRSKPSRIAPSDELTGIACGLALGSPEMLCLVSVDLKESPGTLCGLYGSSGESCSCASRAALAVAASVETAGELDSPAALKGLLPRILMT
jgi:hypothetical protein